ncbi:hypothetical protein B566_EDAN012143 [Ephemera danica]|nr:hypothetical protein B566_EDAN012143 [Ephemera danica]
MMKLSCVVVFLLCSFIAVHCNEPKTSCLKGPNGDCIPFTLYQPHRKFYKPVSVSDKFPEREYLNPSLQVEDNKPKSNNKKFQNAYEDEDYEYTNTNPWIRRTARHVEIYSQIDQSRSPCPEGYVRYSTADECTLTFSTTTIAVPTTTPIEEYLSTNVAAPHRTQSAVHFESSTAGSNKRFSGFNEDEE